MFEYGWKFVKWDVVGAEVVGFDDGVWIVVSFLYMWNVLDG